MKKIMMGLILLAAASGSYGQGMNNWWVFPDSIAIDFSSGNPVVSTSNAHFVNNFAIDNPTTISDKNGNLLFYLSGIDSPYSEAWGEIMNSQGQIVSNSNQLHYGNVGVMNSAFFLPDPADTSQFYLLQMEQWFAEANFNVPMGFSYSKINKSFNNGQGSVIVKNQMVDHDTLDFWIGVTKHANGRDWWIITHKLSYSGNNEFDIYLLDPSGITLVNVQNLGQSIPCNCIGLGIGASMFSNFGSHFLQIDPTVDYVTLFDFDRCNGLLSNPIELISENNHVQGEGPFSASFSSNDSNIYLSDYDTIWTVKTYDPASYSVLWNTTIGGIGGTLLGQSLAIDDKIYFTQKGNLNYLQHLACITSPNTFGAGCNFQHSYLSTNGHIVKNTLPSLPNYSLGPLAGSPCDTLTSTHTIPKPNYNLSIAPNPASGSTTVFYNLSSGQEAVLRIYNNLGQLIQTATLHKGSNHYEIDISHYAAGLYYALIGNGEWNEGRKFVVE